MASNALLDLFEQSNEDTQILNQYANTNPFEITKPGAKFGKFFLSENCYLNFIKRYRLPIQ